MSIRSVKFVPAVLAGVVAGANLATTTDLRAQVLTTSAEAAIQAPQVAADGCLAAPKGPTPAGSHWYYRLDRVTKRQCWYLREEGDATDDKFARAAPPPSAPSTSAAPTAEEPATPQRSVSRKSITDKSISDARAEWQPRAEVNLPARVERTVATAAPAPVVPDGPRAAMPNVLAPAPLSTLRWNDAAPTRASVNPAEIQLAAATPPAAPLQQAEEVQSSAAEQVVPAGFADASSAKPTASLQKLFMVMAAALALAGLTVSAIVRVGRLRARRAMKRKRRAMWDSAKTAKTRRRAPPPQAQPQPQAQLQPVYRDEDTALRRAAAAQQHARAPQPQAQLQPQPMFRDEEAVLRRAAAAAAPQPRMAPAPTRPPRERPQQERPYAPQERRQTQQDRMPQQRAPQERAAPPDRDRERQVTEMLSRLARTAHS